MSFGFKEFLERLSYFVCSHNRMFFSGAKLQKNIKKRKTVPHLLLSINYFLYFCNELSHEIMALNPNKDLKLYYSIGEVAQEFGVNESLLRFWESEFPSIAPKKNGRGVRMYTKENIEEIRLIYNLVKVRGMKLSVAQKTLAAKRGAVQNTTQVLEQLQQVRNELVELRKLLNGL